MSPTTLLYVPADQPAMLTKARQRNADAVIIDLEDAVPVDAKDSARQAARDFVIAPPAGASAIYVRVNGDQNLGLDVEAVAHPNLAGIVIAKAQYMGQVEAADRILFSVEEAHGIPHGTFGVTCLIETAIGLREAFELASHPRVNRLGLGEADLGADLGIDHAAADSVWDPIRLRIVVDSAAAAIDAPAAPVSTNFTDMDELTRSTTHLSSLGFGSRAAIHPAQIPVIEEAFRPTDDEVEAAKNLLHAHELSISRGDGVFTDAKGRMVDEAVVRHARRTMARSSEEGSA
ncbi:MAG: HpcH/HpaI aldolase/citrate lyase family protein [Acidimicrobiia bacterium]